MVDAVEFGRQVAAMVRAETSRAMEPLATDNASLRKQVEALQAQLEAMPAPQQGERGDTGPMGPAGERGEHGAKGLDGSQGERGEAGPAGRDGADGQNGRDGAPGRDGVDGKDGKDGETGPAGKSITVDDITPIVELAVTRGILDLERRAADTLQRAIDRIPVPKDGASGKDGVDGLGFDDMQVDFDGERAISLKFIRGDVVKSFEFEIPTVIDRDVYQDAVPYAKSDGVSYGGSWWIARKDLPEGKPGTSPDWRLAVKRGRDGRDGRDGIDKTATVKLP